MGPAIAAAGSFWTPFALGSSLQDPPGGGRGGFENRKITSLYMPRPIEPLGSFP